MLSNEEVITDFKERSRILLKECKRWYARGGGNSFDPQLHIRSFH